MMAADPFIPAESCGPGQADIDAAVVRGVLRSTAGRPEMAARHAAAIALLRLRGFLPAGGPDPCVDGG
jgi:hypothetical protein